MQGVSQFGLLQSWMASFLVEEKDTDFVKAMVVKGMMPLDSTISQLHFFIDNLLETKDQLEIDLLLESEIVDMIINGTQWRTGQMVTMANKEDLVREVLYAELCTKSTNRPIQI